MSVDLFTGVLMGPKGLKPNWKAAKKKLKAMDDMALLREVLATVHGEDELSAANDLDESKYSARRRVSQALENVKDGWNGDRCDAFNHFCCFDRELLIAGGMSCGDAIEEVDDLYMVFNLGLAEAAGFMHKSPGKTPR